MNEAKLVYGIDGERRLGNVELSAVLGESVLLHQQSHHIATRQELQKTMVRTALDECVHSTNLHNQVQIDGILKTVIHFDNPLMVGLHQNVTLRPDMSYLLLLEHVGLAQYLHSVHVTCIVLLHQSHCERTSKDQC